MSTNSVCGLSRRRGLAWSGGLVLVAVLLILAGLNGWAEVFGTNQAPLAPAAPGTVGVTSTKDADSKAGGLAGIGVLVRKDQAGGIYIRCIDDGVAERAHLYDSDLIITSVDGKSLDGKSISEIESMLAGKAGTTVSLGITRKEAHLSFIITLTRETPAPKIVPVPREPTHLSPRRLLFYLCFATANVLLVVILWRWYLRWPAKQALLSAPQPLVILEPSTLQGEDLTRENPWPGLTSFRQEDAAFFYGRRIETQELFRLIKSDSLTLLFGKSGLGKSSLINAGLFPLLKGKEYLPVYVRFDHSEKAPSLIEQFQQAVAAKTPPAAPSDAVGIFSSNSP